MIFTDAEISRFWTKVDKTDGCWLWTAGTQSRGYGAIGYAPWTAHKFSYLTQVGPIPVGLTINHICGVKRCVRPDHLEAVTYAENNQHAHDTGLAAPSPLSRTNAAKIACPAGHFYSDDNTYTNPQGHRQCRTCKRESDHRRAAKLRDKLEDVA